MSFFNLRRSESVATNAASGAQPESAELVRKRAKHRLIGSAVLVLAGVLGFPLLFDTQPRPVSVEIPIEIPDRNTSAPLSVAPAASAAKVKPTELIGVSGGLGEKEEIFQQKQGDSQTTRAQAAIKTEAKPVSKAEVKAELKTQAPEARPAGKATAASIPGDAAKAAATEGRLVVQVGAYSDADKARDARLKLEKAGFKTYIQVTDTKDGKRIRVRVGPFSTKAEADKAASKIKSLDMPTSILVL